MKIQETVNQIINDGLINQPRKTAEQILADVHLEMVDILDDLEKANDIATAASILFATIKATNDEESLQPTKETKSQKLFKQLLANVTCECSADEKEDALKDGMACHCMTAPSSWADEAYEAVFDGENEELASKISDTVHELADLLIQDTAKGYM